MRIGEAIRDNMADLGYGAEAYRVGTISHLLCKCLNIIIAKYHIMNAKILKFLKLIMV